MSDIPRSHGAAHDLRAENPGEVITRRNVLDFGDVMGGNTVHYTQKSIDAAKKVESDAEKMLGKLDIDGKPGVSRAEIIAAEGKKNVSSHDMKIYGALNNMEPSVQDAWQVPDHRKHLAEHAQADFYRSAADLLKRGGERAWADDLVSRAGTIDKKSTVELAADRKKQDQVYFQQADVTPAKLAQLKEQIQRVELAVHTLPHADKAAASLLKKLDPTGRGLTFEQIEKLAHSPENKNMTWTDRTLLQAVANSDIDTPPGGKVGLKELTGAIKTWSGNESRADRLSPERTFYLAMEGYSGNGLDIRNDKLFQREMDSKDMSQLHADAKSYDYHSVPRFGSE